MTALVFCDGFDKYGPPGNISFSAVGEWSLTQGGPVVGAPLSSLGFSWTWGNIVQIDAPLLVPCTRVAGSMRYQITAGTTGSSLSFILGASYAFTINFSAAAGTSISLRTGNSGGTLIATGGTVASATTHIISWDITVGAAAAYAIYLDGILIFSGTGNTGNGLTSVNTVELFNSAAGRFAVDDLVVMNASDPAYNSSILTSAPVVETTFPNNDVQTQFINDGNVLWADGLSANGVSRTGSQIGLGATNQMVLLKVVPVVNCTLVSVSVMPSVNASAVKIRAAVYSDSAGSPNALLGSSAEVTGLIAATMTLPLLTPLAVTAGTPLWLGFNCDVNTNFFIYQTTPAVGRSRTATFTSPLPNPAGAMGSASSVLIWGNCINPSENFASVLLNPPLGTAGSQLRSNTVGQEDLYEFPALASTPTVIYGCMVKGFLGKSDSGPRLVSFNTKSGVANSTGSTPNQSLSTTVQWQKSAFDLDPGTGLAWTQSGINAAKSGMSVTG